MSLLDDTVEMVRSNKGGAKIIHRGYMYTVHKKKVGGIRWRCARRILHCKGSITTSKSGPPVINLPHNHVPDLHAVAMARCRSFGEEPPDNIMDYTVPHFEPKYESPGIQIKDEIKDYFSDDVKETAPSPPPQSPIMKSILKPVIPCLAKIPVKSVLIPKPMASLKSGPQKTTPTATLTSASAASGSCQSGIPEPEAEVCLRWNTHHMNMKTSFPNLLDKEQYVDCTLASEGKILKCHRLILSSCSNYFDEMLQSVPPYQHPIIFLQQIPFWQIKLIVEFMYKGEVNVDQNRLEPLLKAAELLQIKGLAGEKKEGEDIMRDISEPETHLDDTFDDYLPPESPRYVEGPGDEDEYKPYQYGAKKKKKYVKKKKIPTPGQIKTVPCNLRGTKSRPNIKQPVFYDPDFPDHNPYRTVSPPALEKDEIFHIDNVKLEPIDIDAPTTLTPSDGYSSDSSRLPLVVELRQLSSFEQTAKKSDMSIEIIKGPNSPPDKMKGDKMKVTNDVEIIKETVSGKEEVDKKKFNIRVMEINELNGKGDCLDNASNASGMTISPPITPKLNNHTASSSVLEIEPKSPQTPPLKQIKTIEINSCNQIPFKKIKLSRSATESVLRKLTEDLMQTTKLDKEKCDKNDSPDCDKDLGSSETKDL